MISHQRRVLIRTKIVRINWKTSLTLFSFSRLVRTTAIGRYSYSKYQSSESSNYPQKHHKWNPLGFEVASGADWQSSENSCWRTARLMEILLKATSHFWRCTECLGLLEFWCVLWWSHPIQQLLADVSLFRVWFEFCGFSDRVFSAICSIYFLCYQFFLKEGIC